MGSFLRLLLYKYYEIIKQTFSVWNIFLSFILKTIFSAYVFKKEGQKTPRNSKVREYTGILTDFFVLSGKVKAEAVLTFMKEQIHGERRGFLY